MVPVSLDGLVELVVGPVLAVEDAKLVVEAVLADKDADEADILKRPNQWPNQLWMVKTGPIRLEKGSF